MVGDRLSDVEAGINNNLYVIGCNFGFSSLDELNNSNIIINEFKQINEILSNIEKSVVLFIDALDQLQFKDSLQWLPKNSLNSFKIVLIFSVFSFNFLFSIKHSINL